MYCLQGPHVITKGTEGCVRAAVSITTDYATNGMTRIFIFVRGLYEKGKLNIRFPPPYRHHRHHQLSSIDFHEKHVRSAHSTIGKEGSKLTEKDKTWSFGVLGNHKTTPICLKSMIFSVKEASVSWDCYTAWPGVAAK